MANDELTPEGLAEGEELMAHSRDDHYANLAAGAWLYRHGNLLIAAARENAALRKRITDAADAIRRQEEYWTF